MVNNWGPQKFQGVGQPNQREGANGRFIDIAFGKYAQYLVGYSENKKEVINIFPAEYDRKDASRAINK